MHTISKTNIQRSWRCDEYWKTLRWRHCMEPWNRSSQIPRSHRFQECSGIRIRDVVVLVLIQGVWLVEIECEIDSDQMQSDFPFSLWDETHRAIHISQWEWYMHNSTASSGHCFPTCKDTRALPKNLLSTSVHSSTDEPQVGFYQRNRNYSRFVFFLVSTVCLPFHTAFLGFCENINWPTLKG